LHPTSSVPCLAHTAGFSGRMVLAIRCKPWLAEIYLFD
jgi:hypothetical protein